MLQDLHPLINNDVEYVSYDIHSLFVIIPLKDTT